MQHMPLSLCESLSFSPHKVAKFHPEISFMFTKQILEGRKLYYVQKRMKIISGHSHIDQEWQFFGY